MLQSSFMLTKIPNGLDEIIQTFGPLSQAPSNLTRITFPYPLLYSGKEVLHSQCHKLALPHFLAAFQNIKDAGLAELFVEFNGIYSNRFIRGHSHHPSTHAWGIAIDMCASQYPLGSEKRMPEKVIECWREAGFFYGGDFKSRKDPMHYQLAFNY